MCQESMLSLTVQLRLEKQNKITPNMQLGKWKTSLANIQSSIEPERTEHEE